MVVGASVVLWAKYATSKASNAVTGQGAAPIVGVGSGTIGWSSASTLQPSQQYMVAAILPSEISDKEAFAQALELAGWSDSSVLYFPGDSLANWPSEVTQPDADKSQQMVAFQGTWDLPSTPVVASQMTALQWV